VLSRSLQIYCRYTDGYAPILLQFFWLWIVSLLHHITGLGPLRYILREIYSLFTKSALFGCATHTHSFKFGAPLLLTISRLIVLLPLASLAIAISSVPLILRVPFNSHGVLLLVLERSRTSRTLSVGFFRRLEHLYDEPVLLRSFLALFLLFCVVHSLLTRSERSIHFDQTFLAPIASRTVQNPCRQSIVTAEQSTRFVRSFDRFASPFHSQMISATASYGLEARCLLFKVQSACLCPLSLTSLD
jgi:hypothetical protein